MTTTQIPVAWKYADPTEDARWVLDDTDADAIRAEDPNLLVPVVSMDEAVERLVAEGYDRADVEAVAGTLVESGFELAQPDEGYLLTAGDVDAIRAQIDSGAGDLP